MNETITKEGAADMFLGSAVIHSGFDAIEQAEEVSGNRELFWEGLLMAVYGFAHASVGLEALRGIHERVGDAMKMAKALEKPLQ